MASEARLNSLWQGGSQWPRAGVQGAGWEIASGKALRGKIGSIRISQFAIPEGPNIVSSSTNYDPGESGLAA